MEEYVQAQVDQSNVECSEEAAQSSADVHIEIIQNSETQSISKEKSEAESPVELVDQPVSDTTAEKKEEYVNTPVDVEYNKGAAEASAAAPVEASVAKTSSEAGTEENKEAAEVPAALTVELKPEVEPSSETEPTDVTNHEPAGVESTACPAEKYTEETVEAVAVVVEESLPETPAVTNAVAAAQETASKDSREPVPDLLANTVSESPTQPATETAVKSVASAAPAQPAPNTRAEEESKSEVQNAEDTAVQPAPETPAEHAAELRIENAINPATASDAEAVQDKSGVGAIELTDALDVEAPTAETDPEPEEDPKQSDSEEVKPNQKSDDANNGEMFEKPAEEQQPTQTMYKTRDGKAVCSFCDQTIDGTVKLSLSEPFLSCHPECLKCAVCAEALGDLLTSMFLHDQVIYCGECFAKALKT
ncbi:fibrous sheath CABYR-binding protein [Scomber scombrus]|uniref:fibrous sheath CABYR-binding protein n=1 Tax=Scomber scombrus TaxID=13677 RepID=UPI002DD90D49|nr:fibrous sheath CABYR-binding protein [Scomber scombrus]